MYGIVKLRQIKENEWEAKFQGNYGLYTIKINTDGKKTTYFSCSCPSDYYPCKHIPDVEEAIAKRIANNKKDENNKIQLGDFIKDVSAQELREFIITQSENNLELQNAVFLEFFEKIENTNGNKYLIILRKALESVIIDENEYYHEEWLNIDILDQWFEKADKYIERKQYDEAILICKACIEEYSEWLYHIDADIYNVISYEYQSVPFDIMISALKHTNKKELFNYCLLEMKKKKYAKTDFFYGFQRIIKKLKASVDTDAFIIKQDEMLNNVKDKSSSEAEKILRQKIYYYRCLSQNKKAWAVIEDNIQIKSFCLKVVKKKISKNMFQEAKELINNYVESQNKKTNKYSDNTWNLLLLDIAQKENDYPAIRELLNKINYINFEEKYYKAYKEMFDPEEWNNEREKLLQHYCNKEYFNKSAAGLLKAENDKEYLKRNIDKLLSLEKLDNYFKGISPDYDIDVRKMYKKILAFYAENFTGRHFYEHILLLLKRLSGYKDGKETALDIINKFRITYAKRTLMMEVLARACLKKCVNDH